jgi:hypothetical protein
VIEHNGALLPSVTLGLTAIIIGLLLCVGLVLAFLAFVYETAGDWVIGGLPVVAALVLIIAPLFGYYPYSGDYHRLQPVSGVVRTIDTRSQLSQDSVITYDAGLVVRCDDSRCATVKPGQSLRLLCTKEHQFGSPQAADGWGCRWGQR